MAIVHLVVVRGSRLGALRGRVNRIRGEGVTVVTMGSLAVVTAPDAAKVAELGEPGAIDRQTSTQDGDSKIDDGPEGSLAEYDYNGLVIGRWIVYAETYEVGRPVGRRRRCGWH